MRSLFTPFIRCTTRANPATDSRRPGPVHRALLSRFQSATNTSDKEYVYAGVAELPMFGDNPDGGRIRGGRALQPFNLDAKLPRELCLRLGGYARQRASVCRCRSAQDRGA